MLGLKLTEEKLRIQKNVVIEEYNQRYLNQPYGDAHLYLRPMAYKVHPYRWPTIGKEISHIENATLNDVKDFFYHHYDPNNAILTVVANEDPEKIRKLVEKWFGPIPSREIEQQQIPAEPQQKEARQETLERDVPHHVLYKAYHVCSRHDDDYQVTDLVSDILANGKSARLYQSLVKEQKLFSHIDAYITGDIDPGLMMINGSLADGVTMEDAEQSLLKELDKLMSQQVPQEELEKVKNKVEAVQNYSRTSALHKAMNISYYELLGDADRINTESETYRKVTPEDIMRVSREIFKENNCSTLYYLAKQ
jgi:predicted Zn-dependent peptidase